MSPSTVRVPPPTLIRPVPVDPRGTAGPTPGEARGPRWRRTSRGLYVPAGVSRDLVEQRILEEACRLPGSGAVTGWAALRLHGARYCDGLGEDGATELTVPLVVPPGTRLHPRPGATVHRERLDPSEVVVSQGIPCTTPGRATFDAARRAPDVRAATVVIDIALASGVATLPELQAVVAKRSAWPGIRRVRAAVDLADARSLSPKESRLRLIWVLDAGLPAPRCNWPVADGTGRFIGRPDLLSQELAVVGEYDGAEHRSRARHRDDVRRDELFRSVGLEPFRVVGADLDDPGLVVKRIHGAVRRAAASGAPRTWRVRRDPGPP